MLRPAILATVVVALSACTGQGPRRDADACLTYFERLDRAQRAYGDTKDLDGGESIVLAPTFGKYVRLLNISGCITRDHDLVHLDQVALELTPLPLVTGGEKVPPTAVHVGVMDGYANTARTKAFLAKLGYGVRTTGVMGLGRRVYIGPFDHQAAIDQAIIATRRAGYIAPYAAKYTRF